MVGRADSVNGPLPNKQAKAVDRFLNSSISPTQELPKEPVDLAQCAAYPYLLEGREGDSR